MEKADPAVNSDPIERRLAAILSADAALYTSGSPTITSPPDVTTKPRPSWRRSSRPMRFMNEEWMPDDLEAQLRSAGLP